jgi:quinol monooxygenase YgiN
LAADWSTLSHRTPATTVRLQEIEMAQPHIVIAVTKALPGQAAKLRALEEELVTATLQEPGCLRYELNQAVGDEHVLIMIEGWATESDWREHSQGAALQRFKAAGGSALIEHLDIFHLGRVAGGEPRS